jgi:hypothetical protein
MTDAIYREVKSSMARYTDMPSILQSMKDKGTLDILSQCLNDIFRSEIDFANKRRLIHYQNRVKVVSKRNDQRWQASRPAGANHSQHQYFQEQFRYHTDTLGQQSMVIRNKFDSRPLVNIAFIDSY